VGLREFESRLERMVEGVFSRVFKSGVRPIELGRRMVREMDLKRSISVRGTTLAPNHFVFRLSQSDFEQLEPVRESLVRELRDAAREHARDESYQFAGPLRVELDVDPTLHTGAFALTARLVEPEGGRPIGVLELPTGQRVALGDFVVSVGRLPECTITLHDTNVSRKHAEIRPTDNGFVVVDLGSTNGTLVNGHKVTEHVLRDGDALSFGATTLTFVAD
jgi:Protein of unknown function (DUF3662)/FHA domain